MKGKIKSLMLIYVTVEYGQGALEDPSIYLIQTSIYRHSLGHGHTAASRGEGEGFYRRPGFFSSASTFISGSVPFSRVLLHHLLPASFELSSRRPQERQQVHARFRGRLRPRRRHLPPWPPPPPPPALTPDQPSPPLRHHLREHEPPPRARRQRTEPEVPRRRSPPARLHRQEQGAS